MSKSLLFILPLIFFSCKKKVEKIKPSLESITESIYASGTVKSKDQYQVFSSVNGIVENVFVQEGDTVKKGTTLLSISNETQKLNRENAQLSAAFSDFNVNKGKLNEAAQLVTLSKSKMKNDSLLFARQKALWAQNIGTQVEVEQRGLAFENSKSSYLSSIVRYNDLKRQLNFNSSQSKKNLLISDKLEGDYSVKSEIDGIVYSLNKSKGEIVNSQTAIAVIGDSKNFILEMQVDEYDILKIKKGLRVLVTLDSYKGQVFEALVSKINPMMNERSKTFLVEAEFTEPPAVLYPNTTFEANIVLQSKKNALLIPREYLSEDSIVTKSNGDKVVIKTGMKDFKKIEIISGISASDELIKPVQ